MDTPNIVLKVNHDTSNQGTVFSKATYDNMREELSNIIILPYQQRLKNVWCDNFGHHPQETLIVIDAEDKSYKIEKTCCNVYADKIKKALHNIDK